MSFCCLAGVLTVAAYSDYREYCVRNELILTGWIISMSFRVYYMGLDGLLIWIFSVVSSGLIMIVLFIFKMLGAGDVKLLSVVGGFTGIVFAAKVFAAAVIVGGVLSVVRCIQYGYLFKRLSYFTDYISEFVKSKCIRPYYVKERDGNSIVIPFSIAIGLGYVIVRIGLFDYLL